MKILNVRFANVNSLKGEFEIDFTDEKLAGQGIFAIMGQTGSGKSTILDAITLALFGRTPRLSIAKSENELMTRGAGYCHAEVTFQTEIDGRGLEFRAIFDQRRSRGKADGALQNKKMQLVQVSPKNPGDDWEAEGAEQVPPQVEKVTGLDFQRFTRTCLLAQGQFAAFLDAKSHERAQILEQITGTQIYGDLSKEAFRLDKVARENIEKLGEELKGVTLLPEAEMEALRQRVTELDRERQTADARKQTIQSHIAWAKALQAFLENRTQTEAQREQVNAERLSRAGDLQRLTEARRAEPGRLPLSQQDGIAAKTRLKQAELQATQGQIPAGLESIEQANVRLREAAKKHTEFEQHAELERKKINEVRAIDQHLQSLEKNRQESAKALADAETRHKATETQIAQIAEKIARLQKKKTELTENLEKAATDKNLGSELKGLEALAVQWNELNARLEKETKELDSSRKEMERLRSDSDALAGKMKKAEADTTTKTAALATAQQRLAEKFSGANAKTLQETALQAQKRQSDAAALTEMATEIRTVDQELKDAESVQARRRKEKAKLEKTIADLEGVQAEIEKNIETLSDEKDRLKAYADFEEYRHQLEDGKPCPLCGAPEHPFAAGKDEPASKAKELNDTLKAEKTRLKKNAEALKAAQKKNAALGEELAGDEGTRATQTKARSGLQKKWDKLIKALGQKLTPQDEEALATLRRDAAQAGQNAEAALEAFQKASEDLAKAEKALQKAKDQYQGLEKQHLAAQAAIEKAVALEKTLVQKRAEEKAQAQALEAKLRSEVLSFGFSEWDHDVLPALKTRWAAYQETQKKLEEITRDETGAQTQVQTASAQKEILARQVAELAAQMASQIQTITAVREQRQTLFGAKDPDTEEKTLQKAHKELLAAVQGAEKQIHDLRIRLESLKTAEKGLLAELAGLAKEREQACQALQALLRENGFADEAALRQALLPPEELKALSEFEKGLETRQAELAGKLQGLEQQIAAHEQQRPTTRTLEELVQDEAQQSEKAAQALAVWQEHWKLLSLYEDNSRKHGQLRAKIETARQEGDRWAKLAALIGSENGKKFKEFAQGLTFGGLVHHANQQLEKLSDRYLLTNEDLELKIIDRYIANAQASARNLSGGEKFLASLALALGLAQMVGKHYRMDSLFIDEGFGALDPETLETAVNLLCGLQQQGKLIGIISHVEALKERIPVQIEVSKLGGGFSSIKGPGCTKLS